LEAIGVDKDAKQCQKDRITNLLPAAPCYAADHKKTKDFGGKVNEGTSERAKQNEALSQGKFNQLSNEKIQELKDIGDKSGNDYQKGIESAQKYSEKVEPIINSQIERQQELNKGGLSLQDLEQKKIDFVSQQTQNFENLRKTREEFKNASGVRKDEDRARLSQNNPEFADKLRDLRAAELQVQVDRVYQNNLNKQIESVQQNTQSSSNENKSQINAQSQGVQPTNQNTEQRNYIDKNNVLE
jgi:hypothetical protein